MIKRGRKGKEWVKEKKRLEKEYKEAGIVTCEGITLNPDCSPTWLLTFHHLNLRSGGKAKHTLEETRLLCPSCHHLADNAPGYKDFNYKLKQLR